VSFRRSLLVLLALLGAACNENAQSGQQTSSDDCSTQGQVGFVRDALQDWYYWYQYLPDPDPGSFDSPEAYLEAVRYRPIDTSYSYVTSKAASDAFYSDSQYIGFGFSYKRTGATELRITQVFPDGSAAEVGLLRGDSLLTVNGTPVAELLSTGAIDSAFGPEQEGVTVQITWRDLGGAEHRATMVKRKVTIPTVSQLAILDEHGTKVGYLHFRNFVQPSVAALDTAFTQLRAGGASQLVLDLRYNGGGLVLVAQHVAGLIAGQPTVGKVFVNFTNNDKHSNQNTSYDFESLPQALGLTHLVVIMTQASASASEAVVNGLRPYLDVKTVGDRSYGKPVGQYGFDFCDKVLYPVCFLVTNARGEADYFDGIPADCPASDDLDHPLANPAEASLAEALYVARTGHCSGSAAGAARLQALLRTQAPQPRLSGWRELVNAW
jgi:carboxyl-terminal processing protease